MPKADESTTWTHTAHGLTITGRFYAQSGALNPSSGLPRPVLHFLHGNGFCAHTYWPLLAKLQAHYDLCLTDLPGHGASPIPEQYPSWRQCAAAVLSAIQTQSQYWGDRPIYALGHSMGGVMTLLMASMDVQRFTKVLLLDPVWFTRPMLLVLGAVGRLGQSHRMNYVRAALRRRAHWPSQTAALEALRERGIYRGWEMGALEGFVTHNVNAEGRLITPPKLEAWYFSRPYTAGMWSALPKLTTPTKAIYGDATYPFVSVGLSRAAKMNAQLLVEETAGGHCFMLQDSTRSAAMVKAWLC